ncbi:hypothetical protein ABT088_51430 [Streptomyces mirabilis]
MRLAHFFERRDPEQAHRWFHDAAEAGESEAMYRLAEFLTGRQADQARHWYRRAAEAGHLQAMYAMGTTGDDSRSAVDGCDALPRVGMSTRSWSLVAHSVMGTCPKRRNTGSAQRPRTTASSGSSHSTRPRAMLASVRGTRHALISWLCWPRRAASTRQTSGATERSASLSGRQT